MHRLCYRRPCSPQPMFLPVFLCSRSYASSRATTPASTLTAFPIPSRLQYSFSAWSADGNGRTNSANTRGRKLHYGRSEKIEQTSFSQEQNGNRTVTGCVFRREQLGNTSIVILGVFLGRARSRDGPTTTPKKNKPPAEARAS